MPRQTRQLEVADLIDLKVYAQKRADYRKEQVARKKLRRLSVGPYATVLFESYDSMWLQVHEMLYVEKGGEVQIADELAAYNPMIPNGSELTATILFEIDDPRLRASVLGRLGGVENHFYLHVGDTRVSGVPEGDVERTREDGKASSVHFMHFPFTQKQIADFSSGQGSVLFGIDHVNYGHMAILSAEMRAELARDFSG
jgi:hypothetical protein